MSKQTKSTKHIALIDSDIILKDIPKYFVLVVLVFLLIIFGFTVSPLIAPIIIASVIATGFYPFYKRVLKVMKFPTIASLLTSLFLLAIIIVPISSFISFITKEAFETYLYIESKVAVLINTDFRIVPEIIDNSFLGKYVNEYWDLIQANSGEVIQLASKVIQNLSQFLVDKTTGIAKQISIMAFYGFVLLISLFFFFRDGEKIIESVKELIPLPRKYRDIMMVKLSDISKGILYGVFGAAMAQGFLGGVGFALVGVNNSAFWGTVMAFFSIVPYIGSTIIWLPAVITLFITGHFIAGIFLTIWSVLIVGTIDNFIKPILIGEKAHIHPLLSFITIFGGIFVFGLTGLIIAPYLLSLVLTFLHIYKMEYKNILEA
jgi:predicted PurR-regulated permease PerM